MYKQLVLLAAVTQVSPGLNGFFPNLSLSLKKNSVLISIESVCPSNLLSPLKGSLFPREIRAIKLCLKPSHAKNFEDFALEAQVPQNKTEEAPTWLGLLYIACVFPSHRHTVILSLCNTGAIVNMGREFSNMFKCPSLGKQNHFLSCLMQNVLGLNVLSPASATVLGGCKTTRVWSGSVSELLCLDL